MHELGIMTGVVESVGEAARANHADKVLKVSLSVGVMTEAIEDALRFAFDALCEQDPLFEGAELDITMVEPRSRCVECGKEYDHDRYHLACPDCGGFGELIAGRELTVDSIEVDIPDEYLDHDGCGCGDDCDCGDDCCCGDDCDCGEGDCDADAGCDGHCDCGNHSR